MIRFFAGKGGVGKTTCAAAEAARLARGGARTLLVSTDPAHSLADALETKLGAAARPVRGDLFAAELDADRALARWLGARERSFRAIAARGTYLDDEDIDALFRLSLPGVDELVGLIELRRLAEGFDEVVVDTAPTGHTLRLLDMPQTLERIAQVLDDMQAKHRAMALSLRGTVRRDAEDRAIEELQDEARSLRALLRDPLRAHAVWVLLAEELPLAETRDGLAALEASAISVSAVIVNRLTPAPERACALCTAKRTGEARVLRDVLSLGPPVATVLEREAEPRGLRALSHLEPKPLVRAPVGRAARKRPASSARSPVPDWLDAIAPPGVRLVFFGGKGGAGKTTAAATAALAIAARGARTLLLSTDPAHSLGDVFSAAVGDAGAQIAPRLMVREVDAALAFSRRRERYRTSVDELFDRLRGGSAFDATYDRAVIQDLIELAPPGLDELFGLLALTDALVSPRPGETHHDVVVVDTAPTGHALRLLELPGKAHEWVKALLGILLKYRQVVGLGDLARSLTQLARELRLFEELLRDPALTRFVAVSRAAALPRLETARLRRKLRRARIAAPAVIVNALTPAGCSRCRRAARREERELRELRREWRGCAMLGAPAVAPPPRGAAELKAFGGRWTRIG